MATATHSSTSKSARKPASSRSALSTARRTSTARSKDAIQLLKADHREVEKLFSQFQKARSYPRLMQLSRKICLELKVHAQIEEEIFYPTSREFLKDDEIVNEAVVEQQAAKDLITQIEGMDASDELFEATVTVLQELIDHHVEEEEKKYFPQLQKSGMDLKGVGERMLMRKQQLMAQMQDHGMEMH